MHGRRRKTALSSRGVKTKKLSHALTCLSVFGNSSCWVKFKRCIHVLFRLAFGRVHRFTSVKFNFNKKSKVEFYSDVSDLLRSV